MLLADLVEGYDKIIMILIYKNVTAGNEATVNDSFF